MLGSYGLQTSTHANYAISMGNYRQTCLNAYDAEILEEAVANLDNQVTGVQGSDGSNTGRKYWKNSIEFNGNKVYQRYDLFDPNTISSWKQNGKTITGTNVERMASGRPQLVMM